MKKLRRNLVGISVLFIGIFAGLMLIQQNQEYREKAYQEEIKKVEICHKYVDGDWVNIVVDERELKTYLDRGDLLGECPEDLSILE